jgi:tRNA pseudouridine55 synthase
LVILLGKGTKIAGHFMTGDKTYEGVMRLGVATDTHDADGRTTEERDSGHVTRERLAEEMAKYQGDIMQTPPMVSAIKKDGVALYKLARRGEVVERKPRLVHVYEFALGDFSPPRASFRLRCTKGTYVRTLCHDVGQGLGCGAHLEQLRRTMCAGFDLQEANPLDRILEMDVSRLAEHVIPLAAIRTGGPEPSAGNA